MADEGPQKENDDGPLGVVDGGPLRVVDVPDCSLEDPVVVVVDSKGREVRKVEQPREGWRRRKKEEEVEREL